MRMCVCCSLVRHVHAFTVAKGFLGRSLKWKRKTGQFISLCQIIFSTFTCAWSHWPQPWKCCRNLMGRKQLPKVKPQVYILCFTKMKNLRRAVNPRPQWSPSDLESPQRTHETCIVSMHHRDTHYQTRQQSAKDEKAFLSHLMGRDRSLISDWAKYQYYLTEEMEHEWQRLWFFSSQSERKCITLTFDMGRQFPCYQCDFWKPPAVNPLKTLWPLQRNRK